MNDRMRLVAPTVASVEASLAFDEGKLVQAARDAGRLRSDVTGSDENPGVVEVQRRLEVRSEGSP